LGKLLSPAKRPAAFGRPAVEHVREVLGPELVSERRACRVLCQARSTQRYDPVVADHEARLRARIVELASEYGRYGYRRITGILQHEGWQVNHKRVERIWRQEGLKVPQKQPKRRRLWLNDGSCVRLRPVYIDHGRTLASARSYDFMLHRTHDGRAFRLLTIMDEFSRECLAIDVARQLKADDVLDRLTWLFAQRGAPVHLRSDNGSGFTAKAVGHCLHSRLPPRGVA
jgi:putative transposase